VAEWGLEFVAKYVRLHCTGTFTRDKTDDDAAVSGQVQLKGRMAPTLAALYEEAIKITIVARDGALETSAASFSIFDIDGVGTTVSHTEPLAGWRDSISAEVVFEDWHEYTREGEFACVWSGFKFYVDGVVVYVGGPGIYGQGGNITAISYPFWGAGIVMSAQAGIRPIGPTEGAIPDPPTGAWLKEYESITTGECGWSSKRYSTSAWEGFPINLSVNAAPALGGGVGSPAFGTNSGTTTEAVALSARNYRLDDSDGTERTVTGDSKTSIATIYPSGDRGVERMNSDYGAVIARRGFPYAKGQSSRSNLEYIDGEYQTIASAVDDFTLNDEYPSAVGLVTNAAHDIEEPFTVPCYCGYLMSASASVGINYASGLGGSAESTVLLSQFPTEVQERDEGLDGNIDILPALDHDHLEARYFAVWGNPHYSFHYQFPESADPNGPVMPFEWPVYNQHAEPAWYWIPNRHQWAHDEDWDVSNDTNQRTTLMSAPLLEGLHSWVTQSLMGMNQESAPWGISRFTAINPAVVASKQLDSTSSPGWSFTDCAASFLVGGIQLTPSASTIRATLDLGRWDCPPYLYPLIAKSIEVGWVATNITSVSVRLEGISGRETVLATTPGTYDRPAGEDDQDRYAGSWAQDFHGFDTGTDMRAHGISPETMADPERSSSYGLLAGYTARKLHFVIEVTNPALTVEIAYPEFHLSADDCRVITENGHQQAVVWPDGPAIRFGQLLWFTGMELRETPSVMQPGSQYNPIPTLTGYKSTTIDLLCWINTVLKGVARDDSLAASYTAIHNVFEGRNITDIDTWSLAFLVENGRFPTGIAVQTAREMPPRAWAMRMDRDADWQDTGNYCLKAYSYAVLPRYYLCSGFELHLYTPGAALYTTNEGGISGWGLTKHSQAVDNTEGPSYAAAAGGDFLALVCPWHGYTAMYGKGESADDGGIHMAVDAAGVVYAARTDTTGVHLHRFNFRNISDVQTVLSGTYGQAQVAVHPSGMVGLCYGDGGDVERLVSYGFGDNFGSLLTVATGTSKGYAICPMTGIEYAMVYDTDRWKFYSKTPDASVFSLVNGSVLVTATDEDGGLAVLPDGLGRIVFCCMDAGTFTRLVSTDRGDTWV
jgi:hypothetical protein